MNAIKYKTMIDLSVKNNSHTIAFTFIDQVADGHLLNILEVGCSSAYFGSALKTKGHTVWGIEPNKNAALIAIENLDFVFTGSIEDFIIAYPDKKFDVITFGDVLEHIAEPNSVLDKCHGLLADGGAIVASVPNAAHISVRAMLLEGKWQYSELGILDKTHLRFFTRNTIQDLFVDTGYAVIDIMATHILADDAAKIAKTALNKRAIDCVEGFAADNCKYDFQYVLLAVPANIKKGRGFQLLSQKPKIKVLALAYNIEQSHFNVRLGDALKGWANLYGGELICKTFKECDQKTIEDADILIIQRHIDVAVMRTIFTAQRLGKKIVFEIDDLLTHLPEFLSHHKAALVGYESALSFILKHVHCMTVTTKRMAQQLEPLAKPLVIIPNCVSAAGLQPIDTQLWKNGRATIIISASDKVLVDFILPALSRLITRKDITVKVVVIGPIADAFDQAGVECQRVPHLTYDAFKKFIRTLDNPIGVIPLDDSLIQLMQEPSQVF